MELARDLREAARRIGQLDADAVSGSLFNDVLRPESYERLFEDLADKAEPKE